VLPLASIITIVIGVGITVQAFKTAAERSKALPPGSTAMQSAGVGGDVMVDLLTGITGIVLGILALLGINAVHLVPAALIVFGGALRLSGVVEMMPKTVAVASPTPGRRRLPPTRVRWPPADLRSWSELLRSCWGF
jgi:hypothetical protein